METVKTILQQLNSKYITHDKEASWGGSIMIMEKEGKAFARIYWYDNDNTTVYLDSLSVNIEVRKQGIATELQELREKLGSILGATKTCLWVKKNSWMQDWYKRRGYIDWKDYENEEDCIWMRKELQVFPTTNPPL